LETIVSNGREKAAILFDIPLIFGLFFSFMNSELLWGHALIFNGQYYGFQVHETILEV
jgi:hypothetical protein